MGIKAYPNQDSIHVGDTVWIEVNEPTTLRDAFSGKMIDYSGTANLGSVISFQAYSSITGQFTVNAANKFDFVVAKGTQVTSMDESLDRQYIFKEENQRNVFKLAIIAKET